MIYITSLIITSKKYLHYLTEKEKTSFNTQLIHYQHMNSDFENNTATAPMISQQMGDSQSNQTHLSSTNQHQGRDYAYSIATTVNVSLNNKVAQ